MTQSPEPAFDAILPPEMAAKAEAIGVRKARLGLLPMAVLAALAGAFISLGAVFMTTVTAGAGATLPYGVVRLLGGLAFSLGLILVLVGGAELFTGNTLLVMAWANRKVTTAELLRSWCVVYLGNFAGALATAVLVFAGRQFTFGGGAVGATALAIAQAKLEIAFLPAIALGVLGNGLVCLAVWLGFSARTTTDRILAIVPPIAAFVAAGFEHSVANMYLVPFALLIKAGAPDAFWEAIGRTAQDYPLLTWGGFLVRNLLPVTIGNVLGGTVLVGAVYWLVYLAPRRAATPR